MKRFLRSFVALVLISAPLTAPASDTQGEIEKALFKSTQMPDASWWQSLGPDAPLTLQTLYQGTKSPYQKIRIVEAMGNFSDAGTDAFLKKVAGETSNQTIRCSSIRSVAKGQGAKEKDFLTGMLNHSDPHTRATAAEALNTTGDADARQTVESFLAQEKTGWVVDHVRAHVKKLETPPDSNLAKVKRP